ncbi:MAG TPA: DegT/DnrJ/EryC1/StrS family aminotransferase [Elusimicrobiota bacterium]|nr:DegT/DnrJ/EryC1/StrS family aminotransferase [Elusimicrobiota bacterium]HNC58475.1 DegT/DnrJ/EryC1/StrS family aminotransferase [Leptospiraceae bacterium]
MKRISLTEVSLRDSTIRAVRNVLHSGRIGQGPLIEEFEERFAEWVGSKYAVAVSSGTMADTIAMAVLKEFFPLKTEVMIPALTFAAHLNSIIYNGLTPVFYDTVAPLERENTLCDFPVHLLGIPRLSVNRDCIEDSCEAMGSKILKRKCGTFGRMGTFSFFPSHTMTTGEGGMIVTDREDYALMAKTLRNHGKRSGRDFHFDVIGFNGKMTSLQAAIGIESLKNVDDDIQKRRENWIALGGREMPGVFISPHAYPVILNSREERDDMMKRLEENNIECRNLFSSLPTQEKAYERFGYKLGAFPVSEKMGDCGLYVPCHQYLTKQDLKRIKEIISEKETQETPVLK